MTWSAAAAFLPSRSSLASWNILKQLKQFRCGLCPRLSKCRWNGNKIGHICLSLARRANVSPPKRHKAHITAKKDIPLLTETSIKTPTKPLRARADCITILNNYLTNPTLMQIFSARRLRRAHLIAFSKSLSRLGRVGQGWTR